MGWFGTGGDTAERELLSSLATVLTGTGQASGCGVYLTGRHVLTCAHVVNDALGRSQLDPSDPGPAPLRLGFRSGTATARCTVWVAPRAPGGGPVTAGTPEWHGDLALLELDGDPPPGVVEQRWLDLRRGQNVRAWYSGRAPESYVDTTVTACGPALFYLDRALATGPGIVPGYSGGPLWSPADEAVVGLVVGKLTGAGYDDRGLAIPWQVAREQLVEQLAERLGESAAHRLLPPAPAAPADGPYTPAGRESHRRLAAIIRAELSTAALRGRHARAMADACGLTVLGAEDSGPAPDELAAVLADTPRALAALCESLRPAHPGAADRLAAHGRMLGIPTLLSPEEHGWLVRLLGEPVPDLPLGTAFRAALPDVPLPADVRLPAAGEHAATVEQDAVPGLIAHLETLHGGPSAAPGIPRVPPLLRLVEYRAAQLRGARPAAADEHHDWAGRVARRLGIPDPALLEHRADAADWAARATRTPTRPRVAVGLSRYQHAGGSGPGRYLCQVWIDEDGGRPRPAAEQAAEPLSPDAVARRIHAIVAAGGGEALVEFFLDPHDLGLPVEDWDAAEPDDPYGLGFGPEPLGLNHQVVVRLGGELSGVRQAERTGSLRRRWAHRDRIPALHLDESHREPRQVVAAVKHDQRTARVVVRSPDTAVRHRYAAICLVVGVPVVLWDRETAGPLPVDHFEPVGPDGTHGGLAERVRRYRALVHGDGAKHPVRPALAQEHPDRPAPTVLDLFDPEERPAL
ncbi:VMAP-C domain-containing protein [Kitasatospora griseola]